MSNPASEVSSLLKSLRQGDRKGLARAITMVENDLPGSDQLLKELVPDDVPVIGITGPPGAGKSTLINAMISKMIADKKKVAVIAIDPTSPFNYGSLLADRIRMSEHFNNENVFIRSVATRGSLGGLSERIIEVADVMRSGGFDYVIIETVGVGQSEVEIAGLADTTVVVFVPESGDDIQAMKAGIMEIADIFVINKSDRPGADLASANLRRMLEGRQSGSRAVPVINTIASQGSGIAALIEKINQHQINGFNEKRLMLLTEKVFRIARNYKSRELKREEIKKKLEKALALPSFNLFAFAEQYKT